MTELDGDTLDMIFMAMKNSVGDFMFLVDEDNRKLLDHATNQLEDYADKVLDRPDLVEQFSLLRHEHLDLCPDEKPHVWKIGEAKWSERKGYYVYRARCTSCGETCNQEDIPLWNPAVKYDEEDEDE